MFEQIRESKPDYVFWVGDSIPHNVDSLTFDGNVKQMERVTQMVND